MQLAAVGGQQACRAVELQAYDLVDLATAQRGEDDGLVDTVEELRAYRTLEHVEDEVTRLVDGFLLLALLEVTEALADEVRAHIAGHDDDGVLEVHQATLIVGQSTIIEDLQQDVEDIGVRLLDLVEEDDGVRLAAYGLGQLTAFVIAYIARRCTDEAGGGELLLVLAHVNTRQHRLVIEEYLRQSLRQLRLTDPRRAEEDKGADRALGVLQPCTATAYGVGYGGDGLLLPDDALVQLVL